MRITINVDQAVSDSPAIWTAALSPEEVRHLSPPLTAGSGPTVITVEDAEYEPRERELAFAFGKARVLNLGETSQVVIVGRTQETSLSEGQEKVLESDGRGLGPGDKHLLSALHSSKLPDDLKDTAQQLVEFVRALDPAGDLQHKPPRFVSFPDNWVTFQIQPQVREILVTYKGHVPTRLKSASARRPYSGFKVRGLQDVEEAKRVLRGATRRY